MPDSTTAPAHAQPAVSLHRCPVEGCRTIVVEELVTDADRQEEPATERPHLHQNYDCGGKGHGPDTNEVRWCHDCTPHIGREAQGEQPAPPKHATIQSMVAQALAKQLPSQAWQIQREAQGDMEPAPPDVERLRESASEMLLWIDTYDDAMGHGYCAMQSGDSGEPCTCGFEKMRERWKASILSNQPSTEPAQGGTE